MALLACGARRARGRCAPTRCSPVSTWAPRHTSPSGAVRNGAGTSTSVAGCERPRHARWLRQHRRRPPARTSCWPGRWASGEVPKEQLYGPAVRPQRGEQTCSTTPRYATWASPTCAARLQHGGGMNRHGRPAAHRTRRPAARRSISITARPAGRASETDDPHRLTRPTRRRALTLTAAGARRASCADRVNGSRRSACPRDVTVLRSARAPRGPTSRAGNVASILHVARCPAADELGGAWTSARCGSGLAPNSSARARAFGRRSASAAGPAITTDPRLPRAHGRHERLGRPRHRTVSKRRRRRR